MGLLLVRLSPQRFKARVAAAPFTVRVVVVGILLIEILVVFLGGPELIDLGDLGNHAGKSFGLLYLSLRGSGNVPLFPVVIEDASAVLLATVAELPVLNCGIDPSTMRLCDGCTYGGSIMSEWHVIRSLVRGRWRMVELLNALSGRE